MIWRAWRCLLLIILSGVLGGLLGQYSGAAVAWVTGRGRWATHGRCTGWTLATIAAAVMAIGAPKFLLRFWYENEGTGKARRNWSCPREGNERYGYDGLEVEGIKALPVMCGAGAVVGLICGSMAAGMMMAFYFFAVLSPLAPGGWWPVLQHLSRVQWTGDGFVGDGDSSYALVCFIVLGSMIVLGAVLGPFWNYIDVGSKRYRVFRRKPKS